MKLVF